MKQIKKIILKKGLVLFGETHGTSEIPKFLSGFLSNLAKEIKFVLCMEIPKEFENKTEYYFKREKRRGGFSSKEYLSLIKNLRKIGIKIYFIDDYAETQEQREKNLYKNILKKYKENTKTIAILGDFHASKKSFVIGNKKIFPAGYLLNQKLGKKLTSIRISAKKGNFYNNGIKKIVYDKNDYCNKGFNYVYNLDKVSPCSF